MTAQGYTDPAAVEGLARATATRFNALDGEILDALAKATAPMNAGQIADMTGLCPSAIQCALHRLDDDGAVLMRIGRYRLSEAERKRRGDAVLTTLAAAGQEWDAAPAQEVGA